MPKFWYSAKNLDGQELSGEYEADNRDGVVGMLRQSGYYPVKIRQLTNKELRKNRYRVNVRTLGVFCTQLSTILKAGVALPEAFEIMTGQIEDKRFAALLREVFIKIKGGNGLAESFAPYSASFPVLFLSMVEAGEASGTLDVCLERAGESFMRSARLNAKLRNSMIYPMILVILTLSIVSLLMIVVVPIFVKMFESSGAELPAMTRILVRISDFFVKYWYVMIAAVIAATVLFRVWISGDKGRTNFGKFKMTGPVIGKVMAKVYSARYARTLSAMSAAGVPITRALEITARTVDNRWLEKNLYDVVDAVKRGVPLSVPLSKINVFPPMIIHMTKLGEESGELEDLLGKAAVYYEDESDAALQGLTALLEPLIIIFMAIFVVPIILGIMLPVFQSYTMIT